ncbi:MAG: hypothetical protein IBJ17_02345 [Reyranella sp.]|nr:hypothetical protein [Reyranella sp.]
MANSPGNPADRSVEIDALELYASAIDASDYVARVAPLVRRRVPDVGELLDVGAGGGQLGAALRDPALPWSAVEPSPTMQRRLRRLPDPPRLVTAGWQDAAVPDGAHDTVLAATMPAFFDHPEIFLARCRAWARRAVVWVVPAHRGPRGMCFAGCLPMEWHREDETPGIDIVMRGLPSHSRPQWAEFVDWTFTGIVPDLRRLAAWQADRLGWVPDDERRARLLAHLSLQATPVAGGFRRDIARRTAVLVWGKR